MLASTNARLVRNIMPEPTLYAWYSAEEAISFFGSPAEARRLCDGQWVIFENTALCLTDIGKKWGASHFHNGSSFYLVANKPYRVSDSIGAKFVPAEVLPSSEHRHSLRLFARPSGAERYLYAGELEPPSVLVKSLNAETGAAHFKVSPVLPSKILIELGALKLGDLDFTTVDAALDRLRQPTTLQDRISVLQKLVHYWHGPIGLEDGISEAEMKIFSLPAVLRWWYRWAGRRLEIMTAENYLFAPNEESPRYQPTIVDGRLLFYADNQYAYEDSQRAYQWSTLPDAEDPPVFGRYQDEESWQEEGVRLSEHLVLACLHGAVMCHAKYGVWCKWLDENKFAAIVENIPPVAIPPWRWMGLRFFAGRGAFMCAAMEKKNGKTRYEVSIAAKTEHPLQFLKPLLAETEYYGAL
jgi:hypothetical protein